ncbi:MAG TPA: cation:dicarboxylase symporter family transporter [Syntrophorhabdaceae bacterium]|nr:cation:dicarboxylase symporter family transporter [Syntrophorhabdaceae bacterium]
MKKRWRLSQTHLIFIGMLAGLIIGFAFPALGTKMEALSTIFIRLVKTIIVPIIFATLVVGIASHADLKAVGRMGVKAIVYFEIVTTIALFLGLLVVNVTKPGVGIDLGDAGLPAGLGQAKHMTIKEIVINIFPENFFEAAARGDVLEVVVFTIIFAIALSLIKEKKKPIIEFCEALAETMFKYTNIVMRFAPVGVGAAIAVVVASKGMSVLLNLCLLIASFYGAIVVFMLAVLLPVALLFKVPVRRFIAAVKEPAVIAFSTSSSEAALPKAMENMEALGVPRRVVSFVIPTGYSFNLDGTTIYLSLASIFAAQAAGINLGLSEQLLIGFTLIFASKGAAGVPRASLVVLAGTLASFGLPIQAVAVILGVDTVMDMGRTAVNVTGNCLATVIVAKWEKVFDKKEETPGEGSLDDGKTLSEASL